jgi:glycosyltransferase involved in cell wall biosynthesis
LPEAVGDAGLLVDPRDSAAWSAALREFVYDPAISARLRARAVARWAGTSTRQTTDALLAALERTIDNRM